MKITEEFALMLEIFEENHRFIKTIKNYSNSYIEFMNKCDENYYNFTLKMNNIISGGTELEQNEFVDELTQYKKKNSIFLILSRLRNLNKK